MRGRVWASAPGAWGAGTPSLDRMVCSVTSSLPVWFLSFLFPECIFHGLVTSSNCTVVVVMVMTGLPKSVFSLLILILPSDAIGS